MIIAARQSKAPAAPQGGRRHHARTAAARVTALAAAALWLLAPAARAVTIDATWGFGGFHRPGRWTPVAVIVENFPAPGETTAKRGRDIAGRLMLSSTSYDGKTISAELPVNVPWQTRKRYFLYIKAMGDNPAADVRLFDRGGVRYQQFKPSPVPEPEALVVALTRDPGAVVAPLTPRVAKVQHVNPDLAPDRWYGYDGADVVVIPEYAANMLDERRLQALEQWVRAGGRLLVVTGRNGPSYRGSPLESWLPAKLGELQEISASALNLAASPGRADEQKTVITELISTGESETLWQREGHVLAVRRPMGLGTLELWAFDLTGAGADAGARTGVKALWIALFGPAPVADRNRDFFETFTTGFDFGMDIKRPNLLLIGFGLLAYFLAVGPVNFFLLMRAKKLEWGWITVPAIVAVFSVALYSLAYLTKGGELVARSFTLTQARAEQSQARTACIGGLFSPRSGRYTVRFPHAGATLLPMAGWGDPDLPGGGLTRPGAASTQLLPGVYRRQRAAGSLMGGEAIAPVDQSNDAMRYRSLEMKQWSLSYFTGDAPTDLGGPIDADIVREGASIRGALTNNTKLQLDDAKIVIGDRTAQLGDLSPGASCSFAIPNGADHPIGLAEIGRSGAAAIAERYSGVGSSAAQRLEGQIRRMFCDAVLNRWEIGPAPRRGDVALLVAWPRQTPVELEVSGHPTQRTRHAMLVCECATRVAGGGVSFAPTDAARPLHAAQPVLEAQSPQGVDFLRDANRWGGSDSAEGPAVSLGKDAYVAFAFVPPVAPGDGELGSVHLHLKYRNPESRNQLLTAQALNFATGRFDPIDGIEPLREAQWIALRPGEHVNPFDHRVVVLLRSEANPLGGAMSFRDSCMVTGLDVAYRFGPAAAEAVTGGANE